MLQWMHRISTSWVASLFMGALALSFVVWGIADVFTGGTVQRANWTRAGLRHPIVYRGSNGKVIALHSGQTWVELLDSSERVSIVPIK